MRPVGVTKEGKRQKLSCVKLAICQTTHIDVDPKVLHTGYYPGVS